ncbi:MULTISPECIES: phenylalanine--tRNA ligase subunit beta [unclassified Facklamia]|uniref:phenylalanine--tRNA ligase subunit beta n=1 Tax=Aerococcaceae TaxID=186827 RepID=UPI0013BC4734|nr:MULTISPECIES: phenylalanine--tRNA ligase subunit beta [unclassified Facklamia]NEW65169.1 phenylalanine--tRNA ligase subunit beta [Facklamia sp. 252]NEW68560.1 phenylalanine--tRNA ligase subunit beta [Facklamia sp. 253]QQD65971.1 phenylalanine--tRNA ligase subunit beta [Aerococcaceae bacterium zg-252]
MFLSREWLSEFVDLSNVSAVALADKMSRSGIEIEGVENYGENLTKLVVGEVIECVAHPNSDHLHITKVDVGNGTLRQIVCGAPNVHKGAKVITALEGAVLPGDFKIKKSKLRGEVSEGMLCALQELGFKANVVPKKYADGLFLLPQDAPVGESAVRYLQLDDPILELSITPNRADALSMRGAAYEVGAVIDQPVSLNDSVQATLSASSSLLDAVTVEVPESTHSPRYQLRVIKNVTVSESPIWLQMRLMKAGIRPINNIVDVTNYCLMLFGQPMHAFDFDTLVSKAIRVEAAVDGEVFETLDGVERTLASSDLVIKSGETSIALAGVMGGLATEVSDKTQTVLLETAVFDRQSVRKTSNKFNLRSESSLRFEKGINLATIDEAGEYAAHLIAQLGQGEVEQGVKEVNTLTVDSPTITLDYDVIERRLGIRITPAELKAIFDRLGFNSEIAEDRFSVTIPPRRWDITIEADVLEEIARIYGYDNIPTSLPTVPSTPGKLSDKQRFVRHTRQIAEGLGLNQTISYVLTSPAAVDWIRSEEPVVSLALPMSEERSVLRQSLFPALVEIAKYNHARQNSPLAFYEMGKVYFGQNENQQPKEAERLAFLVSGVNQTTSWYQSAQTYDFFSMKGILETYFEAIRVSDAIQYQATQRFEVLHPGRTAEVLLDGEIIGYFGQLHPAFAKAQDLPEATYYAELDFDALLAYNRPALVQSVIPKYPSTTRDLALLVPKSLAQQTLVNIIQENGGEYLRSVELFDRFVDLKIGEDNQSLAYRLTFQNPEKTLTEEDVVNAMNRITAALTNVEGLEIR